MPTLALTVIGRDRPGIIADVTAVVAAAGGNLEDSSMTLLRGHFAWTLIATADLEPHELADRLAHLRDDGLVVTVFDVGPDETATSDANTYLLTVHGGDRPGIVAAVTGLVAREGGNIVDLSTRLGHAGLYVLIAEVVVPASVDVAALSERLAAVGRDLGVDVTLRPAESDVI